jgi:hypothetical protein
VLDPGFDAGLAAWGDAGGAVAVAGAGPDGSAALRVGPGAGGRFQDLVGARPSTTYTLAAWGKVSNKKERGIVCVDVTDGSGATRRSTLDIHDRRWLDQSLQFTTPADLRGIRVWVWKDAGSGDYLFVDQVRVIAVEPAAPAGSG